MNTQIDILPGIFWYLLVLLYLIINGRLLFWMIRAFSKIHPHYKTDENGVTYCPAMRVVSIIKKQLRGQRFGGVSNTVQPPLPANNLCTVQSVALELNNLVKLKDQGHLTVEEFNIQKQKILDL